MRPFTLGTGSLLAGAVLALVPHTTAGGQDTPSDGPGSPPSGMSFIFSYPVRAGRGVEAMALSTRVSNYLKTNHGDAVEFVGLGDWSPRYERATWVYAFRDAHSVEVFFTRLASEDGWRALEEQLDGVFETEAASPLFLLPVVLPDGPRSGSFWWRRTARVTPDRVARALRVARAEAEHVNANYPAARVEVHAGTAEQLGTICWIGMFESSDAWRAVQTGLWSDERYLELLQEAEDLFVEGTWTEVLDVIRQS